MSKFYEKMTRIAICASLCAFTVLANATVGFATNTISESRQQSSERRVVVVDKQNSPIIGVMVVVKGSSNAAVTSVGGAALLKAKDSDVITLSYMGYKDYETTVGSASTINVVLEEDAINLDEIVVVGYGTQKKESLTGAISQVKMDEVLGDRPVTSVSNALQGAVPGLTISGGASPAESKSFNIRGYTSINGGSPLVLVDNVPADIDNINTEDIESISVLKDASSAAIYGARGAFGVILITTKKAQKGVKQQISYSNNFGFQNSLNKTNDASIEQILSSYQDAQFSGDVFVTGQDINVWKSLLNQSKSELLQNGKFYGSYNDIYVLNGDNIDDVTKRYYLYENNQWKNMQDNFGFQQTHNISANGSNETIDYRLSLGYTDQDGVLKTDKDSYNRLSVSGYVSSQITDWLSTSLDVKYAKIHTTDPYLLSSGGDIWDVNNTNFIPRGSVPFNGIDYLSSTPENLLMAAPTKDTEIENPRIYSRTTITPIEGLEAVLEYTYDGSFTDYKTNNVGPSFLTTTGTLDNANTISQYWNNRTNYHYNSLNFFTTYTKSYNKHNFKAMAGFSQETRDNYVLSTSSQELINSELPSLTGSTGLTTASDSFAEYIIRGGFFRFNYDYDNRYLVEVNGRYDGSSKFPTENRYGFFPSVSVGWQVGQEKFMDWSRSWLDSFKIRGSFGQIGNQDIAEYGFVPEMSSSSYADWVVDGETPYMLEAPGLVRSNYTWETVETLNIGFDFGMFKNRMQGTFEWYRRDTKDMLIPGGTYPATVGATAPYQNAGDLRTKGWEFSLLWRDNIGEVNYSVGFNLYDSQSEITKFDSQTGLISDYYVGQQLGEIWGYVTDGYYTIDDFVSSTGSTNGWQDDIWTLKDGVTSISGVSVRPGDVKFKNLSDYQGSDNRIDSGTGFLDNTGDQKIIGNTNSRYQYGVSASADYKGFSLSVMLNGVGKRDVYTSDGLRFPWEGGQFGTIYANQLDYWQPIDAENGNYQPVNPDAEYPRIYGQNTNRSSNIRTQTKYLMDGSYLRIKNITLGYTFDKATLKNVGLSGARIYMSVENLYTFHHLPDGYDPERVATGYPFYRTLSLGCSITL